MQFVKDNAATVHAVFSVRIRADGSHAPAVFGHDLFAQYRALGIKGRRIAHHASGKVKYNRCLISISSSANNLSTGLAIAKQKVESYARGQCALAIFPGDLDVARPILTHAIGS
jgi:hypothetical protein